MTRPNTCLQFLFPEVASYTTHCAQVATFAASTWTDLTAGSQTSATDTPNTLVGSVGAEWYFCAEAGTPFNSIQLTFTAGSGTPVVVHEYWDGAAWTAIPGLTVRLGAIAMNATTATPLFLSWDVNALTGWADAVVNGVSRRCIRFRVTTAFSVAPALITASIGRPLQFSGTIPIDITAGRVFKNVFAELSFYGNNLAGSILGLEGFSTINGVRTALPHMTGSVVSSGESYCIRRRIDLTSAFVANYTGTSQTVTLDFGLLIGIDVAANNVLQGVQVELFVNHEFDESLSPATAQTTLELHSASPNAALTTTHLLVDTFEALTLPTGFVLEQAYFVVECNTYGTNTAGTQQLAVRVNGGTEQLTPAFLNPGISGVALKYAFPLVGYDPSIANTLEMRTLNAATAPFDFACGRLMLTYRWSAASARMLSSMTRLIGIAPRLSTILAQARVVESGVLIAENSITMRRSVCVTDCNFAAATSGAASLSLKLTGEGSYTTYTLATPKRNSIGGGTRVNRKFTNAFARGYNSLECWAYTTTVGAEAFCVRANLVYEHDTPAAGWWAAPVTLKYNLNQILASNSNGANVAIRFIDIQNISSNYYVEDVHIDFNAPLLSTSSAVSVDMALLAGEGTGYIQVSAVNSTVFSEIGNRYLYIPVKPAFARWPGDAKPVNDVQAAAAPWGSRITGIHASTGTVWDFGVNATIRHQLFTISGTLTGYAGDGSGIPVAIYEASSRQILRTTTTAIGGTFSVPWHDNTTQVFVTVLQDSSRKERSENFLPGTPVNIDISPHIAPKTDIRMGAW